MVGVILILLVQFIIVCIDKLSNDIKHPMGRRGCFFAARNIVDSMLEYAVGIACGVYFFMVMLLISPV